MSILKIKISNSFINLDRDSLHLTVSFENMAYRISVQDKNYRDPIKYSITNCDTASANKDKICATLVNMAMNDDVDMIDLDEIAKRIIQKG